MPSQKISDSANIATLDSKIVVDACAGAFLIDITPSVWIGSGSSNSLGASVKVENLNRSTITKDYPSSGYDIVSPFNSVVSVNIPTISGTYQFGDYQITVKLTDTENNDYFVSKKVTLCPIDSLNKKFACLQADINADCAGGKVSIIAHTPPNYQGIAPSTYTGNFTLTYPPKSGKPALSTSVTNFSVKLYEGVYTFSGDSCVPYDFGDNISVKLKFVYNADKKVVCKLDYECIANALGSLSNDLQDACTIQDQNYIQSTMIEALVLISTIEASVKAGVDAGDAVDRLQAILKCDCNCSCGDDGFVGVPAEDVLIEGCGVTQVKTGLTTVYTINNRDYSVEVAPNGGAITVTSPTVQDCNVKQTLTFNIAAVYTQIKGSIYNRTEYDFWGAVTNVSLNNIDTSCLGVTPTQWASMTLNQRVSALVSGICAGSSCSATITSATTSVVNGNSVQLNWVSSSTSLYEVSVYVDGVLEKTALASGNGSVVLKGFADGLAHSYKVVAKCSNGVAGGAVSGDFNYFGCPYIAPLIPTLTSITAACPYNLLTLTPTLPTDISAEWHNQNNTNPSSLVANPSQVIEGTYYVFAKDNNGCYSLGAKVVLVCENTSCTAPQNLIAEQITGGTRVRFQSAAFPPANYTVKRRLASASDVDGNYTTIGNPTWNSTANRWEILDNTTSVNVAYVYRAISNCPSTAPYVDYTFANITCPVVTLSVTTS